MGGSSLCERTLVKFELLASECPASHYNNFELSISIRSTAIQALTAALRTLSRLLNVRWRRDIVSFSLARPQARTLASHQSSALIPAVPSPMHPAKHQTRSGPATSSVVCRMAKPWSPRALAVRSRPPHAAQNLCRSKSRSNNRLPRPTPVSKTPRQALASFGLSIASRVR